MELSKCWKIITRKTLENAFKESGYNEENVTIVHKENEFNLVLIFDYWSEHILFSIIKRSSQLYEYQGLCLLLFDGCIWDNSDFLDECTFNDIIPVLEPANSSDKVQV